MAGDAGTGDRLAKRVTDDWQAAVRRLDPSRYQAEFRIASNLRERMDLVDVRDGIAYELKVSPNNAHFEFYRDVFKAAIAKKNTLPGLHTLIFLTPESSAQKLMRNLAGQIVGEIQGLGLVVRIEGLQVDC